MKLNAYNRWHVQATLDDDERFKAVNDKQLPFMVRKVMYSGGDSVSLSGPAVKTDGDTGLIDRYGAWKITDLAERQPFVVAMILRELSSLLP